MDEPSSPRTFNESDTSIEVWCVLTLGYIIIEVTRLAGDTEEAEGLLREVGECIRDSWHMLFFLD